MCQAEAHRPLCVPPLGKTSWRCPLSLSSHPPISSSLATACHPILRKKLLVGGHPKHSGTPVLEIRGVPHSGWSESPPGIRAKARQWAGVTSAVPGRCQPWEEVMSLNTICLDPGVPGLLPSGAGFQTKRAGAGVRREARVGKGWAGPANCEDPFSLFPRNKVSQALARRTPGTWLAPGTMSAAWLLPNLPLLQLDSVWAPGKESQEKRATPLCCGPYKGRAPGRPVSGKFQRKASRSPGAPFT